jgi:chromosome segregation ATPase
MWAAVGLAIVAIGLLAWAVKSQRDLDDANSDNAALTSVSKDLESDYDDVSEQLGVTTQDLEQSQQDVADAQSGQKQAEQQAADAQGEADAAEDELAKAQAAADQAKADAAAAKSKATVIGDCVRAYASAIGALFEGTSASDVRGQLGSITDTCRAALGSS